MLSKQELEIINLRIQEGETKTNLAVELGVSRVVLTYWLKKSGLDIQLRPSTLSLEEKNIIEINYPLMPEKELLSLLPGRPWDLVKRYASDNKIKRVYRNNSLSYKPYEIQYLKDNYEKVTKEEILKNLPKRNWPGIKLTANNLGLSRRGKNLEPRQERLSNFKIKVKKPNPQLSEDNFGYKAKISTRKEEYQIFDHYSLTVNEDYKFLGIVLGNLIKFKYLPCFSSTDNNKHLISKVTCIFNTECDNFKKIFLYTKVSKPGIMFALPLVGCKRLINFTLKKIELESFFQTKEQAQDFLLGFDLLPTVSKTQEPRKAKIREAVLTYLDS